MTENTTALAGFLRRRQLWLPTWRGWLLLLLGLAAIAAAVLFGAYPFLAEEAPLESGAMVVEGWVNGNTIQRAAAEYQARHYTALYATGLPTDDETPMKIYGSFANYGATRLHELGLAEAIAVAAPPAPRDRTYTCGLTLRDWLRAHDGVPAHLTLVTQGPHARRSRLLFQKAFGDQAQVGVISIPPRDYNPTRWWRTSGGFREVIGEIIAYLYARFLFRQVEG